LARATGDPNAQSGTLRPSGALPDFLGLSAGKRSRNQKTENGALRTHYIIVMFTEKG
jgi:hypothetical protein